MFTKRYSEESTRALGWDTKSDSGPSSGNYFSKNSFGHTGFTGTSVWADPEYGLVYVFLSNRIYPNANNNRLSTGNYRIRIQDVIYQSVYEYEKSHSY